MRHEMWARLAHPHQDRLRPQPAPPSNFQDVGASPKGGGGGGGCGVCRAKTSHVGAAPPSGSRGRAVVLLAARDHARRRCHLAFIGKSRGLPVQATQRGTVSGFFARPSPADCRKLALRTQRDLGSDAQKAARARGLWAISAICSGVGWQMDLRVRDEQGRPQGSSATGPPWRRDAASRPKTCSSICLHVPAASAEVAAMQSCRLSAVETMTSTDGQWCGAA